MSDIGKPAPVSHGYFASDDHALTTGIFMGALLKEGFKVVPETDNSGNFLAKFTVILELEGEPPLEVCVRVLPGKGEGL